MAPSSSSPRLMTSAILKAVKVMRASAFIAAIAAGFTSWTALSVYSGEQERLDYEKLRFTHAAYYAYVDYRRQRKTGTLKCTEAFTTKPQGADAYFVSDDDIRNIFLFDRGHVSFAYDRTRHLGLVECVDNPDVKALFSKDTWDEVDLRRVMDGINEKMSWSIAMLDAALIGYFREVGNRVIMCENFAGFLMTGRDQVGYGIPGVFLKRLSSVDLIRHENYPNLHAFLSDVAKMTRDFKGKVDCQIGITEMYPERPQFLRLWEWSVKQFHYWVG
jgi:hypothetical protein